MSATYPTKIKLAMRSGDRCALCRANLTPPAEDGNPNNVGEAAHIAGERQDAPRYDGSMTDNERDHYANLIYLCSNCHTIIDDRENGAIDYPTERLLETKSEHERKVHEVLSDAFANIGFPELELASRWILNIQPGEAEQDFYLVPPEDKIRRNNLGNGSKAIITMGFSVVREVGDYVESITQTDSDFPEQLKAGFLQEYYRLRGKGYRGDALFDLMCRFSQRGFEEQTIKTAGLAVLIYLFEACDVFEK